MSWVLCCQSCVEGLLFCWESCTSPQSLLCWEVCILRVFESLARIWSFHWASIFVERASVWLFCYSVTVCVFVESHALESLLCWEVCMLRGVLHVDSLLFERNVCRSFHVKSLVCLCWESGFESVVCWESRASRMLVHWNIFCLESFISVFTCWTVYVEGM